MGAKNNYLFHSIFSTDATNANMLNGQVNWIKIQDMNHCVSRTEIKAHHTMYPIYAYSSCPKPNVDYEWNTIIEQDDTIAEQTEKIMESGSLLWTSRGGSGKSFIARNIIKKLRDRGERVMSICLTHVGAKIVEGSTIQSFLYKHVLNGSYSSVLAIDECSMV